MPKLSALKSAVSREQSTQQHPIISLITLGHIIRPNLTRGIVQSCRELNRPLYSLLGCTPGSQVHCFACVSSCYAEKNKTV